MSGHFNTRGDTGFLKNKFNLNLSAGEKLMGHEFEMAIDQYPDVNVLVRSTQFAAMGRSDVEDFGPMGLKFTQHGALENSGEITVTCAETLTGRALAMVRDIIKHKKYIDITIRSTPESTSGGSAAALKQRLEYCKLRCDAVDLSTEDQASLVKPSMTIVYNWIDI